MAKGSSGRIVIEIDPKLKNELYSILAREGKTLKDWFVIQANNYLRNNSQLGFEFSDKTGHYIESKDKAPVVKES